MNTAKWDAVANDFIAGTRVPAQGWEAWAAQATQEAITIRAALPESVEMLLEVGCGVGRLTPYLALLFPFVVATDTSAACRSVTLARCDKHTNVLVLPPDEAAQEACDAALVWCLYDSDWTAQASFEHLESVNARYPLMLYGTADAHWLYEQ